MRRITFSGDLPERFWDALTLLSEDLSMEAASDGFPVRLQRGDGLRVELTESRAVITWSRRVEVYRALSHIAGHWGGVCTIEERAAFPSFGIMFDVSRNAVLKPETLVFFFRKMALMGYDLGMMYTEDTYEVPEYPYFGYRRGKYTQADLRALDDEADKLGIELVPCVQTLAHLNRALHWPQMAHLKDTEEVLLVGDERVYDFIRAMLRNASAPYRTRRIHIGMDEAHGLGEGTYRRLHGFETPFSIMKKHFARVAAIVRELGLTAMMWSDMYFRPASPTGGYYDSPDVPPEIVREAPEDLALVYWDYRTVDEAQFDEMFRKHSAFAAPTYFAGGVWSWTGPAPAPRWGLEALLPGLRSAKNHGCQLALVTAWGDNGAEANMLSSLGAFAHAAEFAYRGDVDETWVADRFRVVCGGDYRAFMDVSLLNQLPEVKPWRGVRPANAAKFLLYEDPVVPLYEADLDHGRAAEHYRSLVELFKGYAREDREYADLFAYFAQLAKTLAAKCAFHDQAGRAVRARDREAALAAAALALEVREELEALRVQWRALWLATNRVNGFEIVELRVGGMAARMETAATLLRAFARGNDDALSPLAEEPLPYTVLPDGALRGSYAWNEIASTCKLDL